MKDTLKLLGFSIIFTAIVLFFSGYDNTGQKFHIGSSVLNDSTYYLTLTGKSFLVYDSMRVGKDLFVGGTGGKLYLDTNRQGQIYYDGYSLKIVSTKTGSLDITSGQAITMTSTAANTTLTSGSNFLTYIGEGNTNYTFYKTSGSTSVSLAKLDTISGFVIDPDKNNTTMQLKMPGDTATDYDSDDQVILNRQTGRVTTKSLTTAGLGAYTLTINNSIAATSSICTANINSTSSAGTPIIQKVTAGVGTITIVIYNAHASTSLNNTISINFMLNNYP